MRHVSISTGVPPAEANSLCLVKIEGRRSYYVTEAVVDGTATKPYSMAPINPPPEVFLYDRLQPSSRLSTKGLENDMSILMPSTPPSAQVEMFEWVTDQETGQVLKVTSKNSNGRICALCRCRCPCSCSDCRPVCCSSKEKTMSDKNKKQWR